MTSAQGDRPYVIGAMLTAHLVFADINKHSEMPFTERRTQLETFWKICDEHRPASLSNSKYSFFDVDNDSLMAGFSGVPELWGAEQVLFWAVRLYHSLRTEGVPASFALSLIEPYESVDWRPCRGFVADPHRLYIPDDVFERHGRVVRSRLVGDSLIVTSRLLELAKRIPYPVVFSYLHSGDFGVDFRIYPTELSGFPGLVGADFRIYPEELPKFPPITECTSLFSMLGHEKERWLTQRQIRAWALLAEAEPGLTTA